ncbi:GNAT family N-acetyltransferase [Clavibacter capsici]|uniref:GNAT family N-acetyltransferase n=1 Tax=Clavibacter capsici TaxID=1874630 RepID=UPI00142867B3|nr:GNAT family N-acetyltransferase [Clavibacter capsici]QIS42719.1 GNAT family N-acetyltransferase [Clavibacter capsici]
MTATADPLPDRPRDAAGSRPDPAGILIRAAGAADMPAVAELRWRWSVDEGGVAPVTDPAGYVAAIAAFAAAHPRSHGCHVAERDGVVVGLAWLALTDRPPTPDDLSRVAGDVQSVYVIPELRGSGTGSRLVAALLDDARAAGCRYVRVHSSPRAIPLYARAGFAVDETYRVVRL